jgi:hypothetical protein
MRKRHCSEIKFYMGSGQSIGYNRYVKNQLTTTRKMMGLIFGLYVGLYVGEANFYENPKKRDLNLLLVVPYPYYNLRTLSTLSGYNGP